MQDVIVNLIVVEWLCNDLHYKWRGHSFYGMHLLADRVRDFGSAEDDINETFYLGFEGNNPPTDSSNAALAIKQYDKVNGENGNCPLRSLAAQFSYLAASVETAKRIEGLPSGIHSILDNISQKAFAYRFLVTSSIEGK